MSERQPAYQPRPGDLERMLAVDYPDPTMRRRVVEALQGYASEYGAAATARVRLAILKLAAGDPDRIGALVATAVTDYRDVLAWAEYPRYMTLDPGIDPRTPRARQAIRADRAEYESWVERA